MTSQSRSTDVDEDEDGSVKCGVGLVFSESLAPALIRVNDILVSVDGKRPTNPVDLFGREGTYTNLTFFRRNSHLPLSREDAATWVEGKEWKFGEGDAYNVNLMRGSREYIALALISYQMQTQCEELQSMLDGQSAERGGVLQRENAMLRHRVMELEQQLQTARAEAGWYVQSVYGEMLTHEEAKALYGKSFLDNLLTMPEKPGTTGVTEAFDPSVLLANKPSSSSFAPAPYAPRTSRSASQASRGFSMQSDARAFSAEQPSGVGHVAVDDRGGEGEGDPAAVQREGLTDPGGGGSAYVRRLSGVQASLTRQVRTRNVVLHRDVGGGKSVTGIGIAFVRAPHAAPSEPFLISHVYPHSPASRSGQLQVGDFLCGVNHVSVAGKTAAQVTSMIVGKPGTAVTLTLNSPRPFSPPPPPSTSASASRGPSPFRDSVPG